MLKSLHLHLETFSKGEIEKRKGPAVQASKRISDSSSTWRVNRYSMCVCVCVCMCVCVCVCARAGIIFSLCVNRYSLCVVGGAVGADWQPRFCQFAPGQLWL